MPSTSSGPLPVPTLFEKRVRLNGLSILSVQVNIPAESGEMGVLANHVPSIEQLKPGMVEIIEESGGSKQFFCMCLQDGPLSLDGRVAYLIC